MYYTSIANNNSFFKVILNEKVTQTAKLKLITKSS